jgi:hypothetical protein
MAEAERRDGMPFRERRMIMALRQRAMAWTLCALFGMGAGGLTLALADDLAMDQIPEAARKALLELARGAKIEDLERERSDGVEMYEAEWEQDGLEFEATVLADGTLIELEEELASDQVPPAVRAAAEQQFGRDADLSFEKKTHVVYKVDGLADGRGVGIFISVNGRSHRTRVEVVREKREDAGDE